MSAPEQVSANEAGSVVFNTAIRGYDITEIDTFLGEVRRTLQSYESGESRRTNLLSSTNVVDVLFSTAFRGYDLAEVDDFLDRVVDTLVRYESAAPNRIPVEAKRVVVSVAEEERASDESTDQPSEETARPKPISSDEILEQAKKWLNK